MNGSPLGIALLGLLLPPRATAEGADEPCPPAVEALDTTEPAPPELPPLVPPRLEHAPPVSYPPGMDRGEVEVLLELLIDASGRVESVKVLTGEEPFAGLAVQAAQRFRFSPALEQGQPTPVVAPYRYVFPAPPVNVRGVLRHRSTGEPAAGVVLAVDGRTVETGPDGRFGLRNVAPGEHTLRALGTEVHLEPRTFTLDPGEEVAFELQVRKETAVPEILGTYEREAPQVLRRTLTSEEVRTTPGTLGDPIRAIQNLPGVVRTPLDAGWLLVRGSDPEDTGLYLDGIRVPLVYHLLGLTSVIHPSLVERVEFMPAGYDVRYGRATGGAVNLRTKDAAHLRTAEVEAGADLVSAGVFARVPLRGDKGFAAAVRRSYLDAIIGAVAGAGLFGLGEGAEEIAPRYWDWQARLDAPRWGLLGLGYADRIYAPTADSDRVELSIGTQRLHGRYEVPLASRRLQLTPMVGLNRYALTYPDSDDERTRYVFGGRAEIPDPGTGPVAVTGGLDVEAGWYAMSVQTEHDDRPVTASANYHSWDPYLAVRLGRDPLLRLGARLETLFVEDQLPRAMPSPRASGRYPLAPWLALVGSAGMYHQWPPLDQVMALPGGVGLHLEESWGGNAGVRLGGSNVVLESDAWARWLEHVTLVEDDDTLGQGEGRAWGVENLLKWRSGRWRGWISYAYSRSLRREETGDLLEPHLYDQPHYLVTVASWSLPRDWNLAGRFRYGSGYPWDPDETTGYDLLYQEERCLADASADPAAGCPGDTESRLPAFHALDLKVSRRFAFRRWSLHAWLDVQNLYNRRIAEPIISGSMEIDSAYTYTLPILPIIGLEGTFHP